MSEFGCSSELSDFNMDCQNKPLNSSIENKMINMVVSVWNKKIKDQIAIECTKRGVDAIDMDLFIKSRITILRFEPNLHLNFVHLDFIDKDNVGELLFYFDTSTEIQFDGMTVKFNIG